MRAATYARQSLDVAEGIARQDARTAALIEARGWTQVASFRDNDTSASKARGAGTDWARMLRAIAADEVDVVVAVNLDRLLRTQGDLLTLIDSGVAVTTLEGELDLASASGEMQASVLTAMARFEARRKSERQVRANASRVAAGRASTRPRQRPFGYDASGLVVVPEEAEVIRSAYAAVVGGSTLAPVARAWNAAGFETSRGKPWTSGSVALVLASPRYMGQVVYKREAVGKAGWDAIVSEETWRSARARLKVGMTGEALRGRTLLGKLALCGVCGDGTTVQGGSNNGRRSYRCSGAVQHLSRAAVPVEDYVERVVRARLARGDLSPLLAPHAPEMGPVVAEVNAKRARLDELAVDFADGTLTGSQLRIATERLRAQIADLEGRLAASRSGVEFGSLLMDGRAEEIWDGMPIDARRRLVNLLMSVTMLPAPRGIHAFDPESVRIDWRTA